MKRPALQNNQVGVLRMAFRARKVFGTFEKRAPGIDAMNNIHYLPEPVCFVTVYRPTLQENASTNSSPRDRNDCC